MARSLLPLPSSPSPPPQSPPPKLRVLIIGRPRRRRTRLMDADSPVRGERAQLVLHKHSFVHYRCSIESQARDTNNFMAE